MENNDLMFFYSRKKCYYKLLIEELVVNESFAVVFLKLLFLAIGMIFWTIDAYVQCLGKNTNGSVEYGSYISRYQSETSRAPSVGNFTCC